MPEVQTFLPYPDLVVSSQVLDSRRLGKQRVETFQVLRALTWPEYAWKNHPAVRMWRGFVPGLVRYGVENCREWTRRGNADTVLPQLLQWTGGEVPDDPELPPWFGLEPLHRSHRSSLLRKDPDAYRPLFGDEPDDLPYLWPPDVYPRWPARRGDREPSLAVAVEVLGLPGARPAQAVAAHAVAAGRDCLLVARPGSGGSTAGLLAGLATPGPTVVVAPPLGPLTAHVPVLPLAPVRPPPEAADDDADPAEPEPDAAPREDAGDAPPEPPAVLARPPSPVDLLAMQDEQRPPEFAFRRAPGELAGAGLVVLDGVPPGVLPAARPPALVVVPRADPAEVAALLGALRDPVHVGGGWDVDSRLEVLRAHSAQARRRALAGVVREGRTLVVVDGRERLDRTVVALRGDGLRAEGWATSMRASRAAAAVAAWRTRRLDALVVAAGEDPPLGRARVGTLVGVDLPLEHDGWHDLLTGVHPERAVLLTGPDAPAPLAALAAAPGCRRAALLAPYGEPVDVPCGRCDACDAGDLVV